MPRRPSKRSKGNKPPSTKKGNAKLNRWETVDDIPLDEQDAFHVSRDKVLLDGDAFVFSDNEDDDEVFALRGIERDNDEDDQEEEEQDSYEDQDFEGRNNRNVGSVSATLTSANKKKKGKGKQQQNSDGKEGSEEEEEEEETWGRGKAAYYSSNTAQLESEDEEGQELEEQEAKRLQKKTLEGMTDDDFGLNDTRDISRTCNPTKELPGGLPSVKISLPQDQCTLIRHLEKTNPEALALARDWDDTVMALMKTRKRITQLQTTEPDPVGVGMAHLHYQALLTYATTLAFYLHLRTSSHYAKRPELLTSHPIMQRLLTLKQSVSTLEDLGLTMDDSEPEFDEDDDESLDLTDEECSQETWHLSRKKGLESGELDELLKDAQMSAFFAQPKSRKMVVQPLEDKPPKKKRKMLSDSSLASIEPTFDLEEPDFLHDRTTSRGNVDKEQDDAYGEATHLQLVDAADKSARKKTLRFHTSKIEGTSARRQGARNHAMGGDDDIPYRERQKDKEARLLREAKSRIQSQGGEDLDDLEFQERNAGKRKRADESDAESEAETYYELIKNKAKERKEQKKVEYDAIRAAERMVENETSDGPRSLTRAILSNKGLTPHRPKAVRNPRVKKRQKFDKAKKKLASQKAMYKGGLSQTGGRYDGEKSGISKVVKSVKLG